MLGLDFDFTNFFPYVIHNIIEEYFFKMLAFSGTIGEVLEALLKLECLNILELLRPKLEKYIKLRDSNELVPMMNMFSHHEKFYSVLKTLVLALGPNDPCQDLHKFSNGIKQNSILVQTRAELSSNNPCHTMKDMSHYQSDLHLNVAKSKWFELENDRKIGNISTMTKKITCKVLLVFSSDGIPSSDLVVNISETMNQDVRIFTFFLKINFGMICITVVNNLLSLLVLPIGSFSFERSHIVV